MTYIIHTEVVQCSGDFNLLLSVEEGIGKLFTFSQCTLNYLETGYVAKEVTNRLVRIFGLRVWVLLGGNGSKAFVGYETGQWRRTRNFWYTIQPLTPFVVPLIWPFVCPLVPSGISSSTGGHIV